MIAITIKTDQQKAELALYEDQTLLAEEKWEAHRQLAETIHKKIESLLVSREKELSQVKGFVCYKGPGSFTGLRIGMSVANGLAYGVSARVVSANGDKWQQEGITRLLAGDNEISALPEYGGEIHITKPRK